MVNEYVLENKYRIGNLQPFIYLLPKNTSLINYSIDDNKCVVNSMNLGIVHKIEGVKVVFNETLNENNRFNFTSSVVITMKEQDGELWGVALEQMKKGNYYVVFEDKMGNQYIQTPEFTSVLSWQYLFTNGSLDGNTCDLTWSVDSNVPAIILNERIAETDVLVRSKCQYERGFCKNLRLCPKDYAYVQIGDNGNLIENIFTTGGKEFKAIGFIENSFTYRQTYKDNVYNEQITFSIPLSDYKYYFHYSLEEFKSNRFLALFETMLGVTVASGVEFGMFPTYTIQTSEEDSTLNIITITLNHIGQYGITYMSGTEPSIIADETIIKVPVYESLKDPVTSTVFRRTEICVSSTQAIYTILEAKTTTNQSTGGYYVLDGYQDVYKNFNIIGIYTLTDELGLSLIHNSDACATEITCDWLKPLPNTQVWVTHGQTFDFVISSECDWQITSYPSWLTLTGDSTGIAGEEKTISFTSNEAPTENPKNGQIVITNGTQTTMMNVTLQGKANWLGSLVYNITGQKQEVKIPYYQTAKITEQNINFVDTIRWDSTYFYIGVQNNTDENSTRSGTITFTNSITGESAIVTINQDKLYSQWRQLSDLDYVCDGNASYYKETKYVGYTADTIDYNTGITRAGTLISEDDSRCKTEVNDWRVVGGEYLCDGANKYYKLEEYVSYDNGTTWEITGNIKTGQLIEASSPDCSSQYSWLENGNTICSNGNLYKVMEKFYTDEDGQTKGTGETKLGKLVEIQSEQCLDPSENNISFTFKFDTYSNTTQNIAYVVANTDFTVNWGDGESTTYFYSDYHNGGTISHAYKNTSTLINKKITVLITGGIASLKLNNLLDFPDARYYSIDLKNAPELRSFESSSMDNELFTIDLTNNYNLRRFILTRNVGEIGLSNFIFPTQNNIQYLKIGMENTTITHITASQIDKIMTDAPNTTAGVMDFCLNVDENNVSRICDINVSLATDKGWYVNQSCCEAVGNKKYKLVEAGGYECDEMTYSKWSREEIYQSEYTEDGWTEWETTGKFIKANILEMNSIDCGYIPSETTIYDWRQIDSYTCDGYDSYYNEQYFYSNDEGKTWLPVIPEEIRQSQTIKQVDDELCGYLPPGTYRERWVVVEDEYLCDNEDLNCGIEIEWIPIGYNWDEDSGSGVFENKTVNSINPICDGTRIKSMANTFSDLGNLVEAPAFNAENVTSWENAFYGCSSLTTVPQYDYTRAENIMGMFQYCSNFSQEMNFNFALLKYVYNAFEGSNVKVIKGLDVSNIDSTIGITNYCQVGGSSIETLELSGLHSYDYDIGVHPNITKESLIYMIEHVIDDYVTISIPNSMVNRLIDSEVESAASKYSVTLKAYL